MSNGKANGNVPLPPRAYYDFFKGENGQSTVVMSVGPSLTRQEFAEECDINAIMARYETTGQLPANLLAREPMYFDFTSKPSDLMDTMDMLKVASDSFMMLPARVRREFDNDPVLFTMFASDPANMDQMVSWGLADPAKRQDEPRPAAPAEAPKPPGDAPTAPGGPPAHVST